MKTLLTLGLRTHKAKCGNGGYCGYIQTVYRKNLIYRQICVKIRHRIIHRETIKYPQGKKG